MGGDVKSSLESPEMGKTTNLAHATRQALSCVISDVNWSQIGDFKYSPIYSEIFVNYCASDFPMSPNTCSLSSVPRTDIYARQFLPGLFSPIHCHFNFYLDVQITGGLCLLNCDSEQLFDSQLFDRPRCHF